MRRGSPGYFTKPATARRYADQPARRCICGRTFWTGREFREHQERCSAVRIAKAAEAKEGAGAD